MKSVPGFLREGYAVLVGAGVSYSAPSSLPSAGAIQQAIIGHERLPLSASERTELAAAISPSWPLGISYAQFLRFEQLVEALHLTCDRQLTMLGNLLPAARPNSYHRLLASMASSGHPILTTNFDRLIEDASIELGAALTPLISERDYETYLADPRAVARPLFKLHGSLSEAIGAAGLITTISEVTNHLAYAPTKWSVVSDLLSKHDLLVIGYSGSDDFDVMPTIKYAKGRRRILWVCHEMRDSPIHHTGLEGPDSLLSIPDRKLAWYFNRLFLSFDYQFGRTSRKPTDVHVIRGRTADLLGLASESTMGDAPAPLVPEFPANGQIDGGALELFCGQLLESVGLFHPAAKHYHSAIDHPMMGDDPLLLARANAWLARLYFGRGKVALGVTRESEAWDAYQRSDNLTDSDRRLVASLPHLGTRWDMNSMFATADFVVPLKAPAAEVRTSRWRQDVTVGVIRRLLRLQHLLAEGEIQKADQVLESCLQWEYAVDPSTRASIAYWSACAVDLRIQERLAQYDEEDEVWPGLEAAIQIFEEQQDYVAWVDALILNAERHLRGLWVDRAYEDAFVAYRLCVMLSNDMSAMFALKLMLRATRRVNWKAEPKPIYGVMVPVARSETLRAAAAEIERRVDEWTEEPDDALGLGQDWLHFPYPDLSR